MLCGNCHGDGYILVKVIQADGSVKYQPEPCLECFGVGEIKTDDTPQYPDSHGNDDY